MRLKIKLFSLRLKIENYWFKSKLYKINCNLLTRIQLPFRMKLHQQGIKSQL